MNLGGAINMIKTVCSLHLCTSCTSCVSICPAKCIHLRREICYTDAVIDESRCLNCGLCKEVCQQIMPRKIVSSSNPDVYVGKAKEGEASLLCSSGGIATVLSKAFLDEGNYVCGSVFSEGHVFHFLTDRKGDLQKFCGSKYVKSDLRNVFVDIKKVILSHKVLFIGTPCQVCGIKTYLGRFGLLKNFYFIDLICHGTPQESVLGKYLQEKFKGTQITSISFRRKEKLSLSINGKFKYSRVCDPYTMSFLKGVNYTENCYSCRFANLNREGDITLGDAWGEQKNGSSNGLSLILVSSDKGRILFDKIKQSIVFSGKDISEFIPYNSQLMHPSPKNPERQFFFRKFYTQKYSQIMRHLYRKETLKQEIKRILIWARVLK